MACNKKDERSRFKKVYVMRPEKKRRVKNDPTTWRSKGKAMKREGCLVISAHTTNSRHRGQ